MKNITPAERTIVAADFDPDGSSTSSSSDKVWNLARKLEGSGCYIKVNSIVRRRGYDLIAELHRLGLKVFVDLKLYDIPETMERDAKELLPFEPDILTVACVAGVEGISRVVKTLPCTEVLGVTVLTSVKDKESEALFGNHVERAVYNLASNAKDAGIGGFICSPHEAVMLRTSLGDGFTINTPGIRPTWSLVPGDDQARIMTPAAAIRAGVDRIVIGRPILKATNPMDALAATIGEIAAACG